MYRIVRKEALRPTVTLYEIEAPLVAKKAQPGQFIILRVDENGERIPITINAYDPEKGHRHHHRSDRGRHHGEAEPHEGGRLPCRTSSALWASPPRRRARRRCAWSAAALAAPLPIPF